MKGDLKMKLKKTAALILAAAMGKTAAAMPVDISVNNNYIKTDTEPRIENGRVLVPVRAAANALGCDDVSWRAGTARLCMDDTEIEIAAGSNKALVNGKEVKFDAAARIVNDRLLVPIRFVGESFGAEVSWDSKTYTVVMQKDGHSVDMSLVDTSYTENDLNWLAKIVHAEAQGESDEGKTGVANVVLNRVESSEFPNTVYDVVFDRQYGVQFTPIANGAIYNDPARESYAAAKKALKGENVVGDSLYFCNPAISTNFWIMNNRTFYKTIGKHDFYL